MTQNRQNQGWPKWAQIAIPAVALIAMGVAAMLLKFDGDGNTRTGVDAFNNLYSGKLVLTESNSGSNAQNFALAAKAYGPPDKYHVVRSKDREDNRRMHDVMGYVRRSGWWFEESFTFQTVRHGDDILHTYMITPLDLNDAQFKAKHPDLSREPGS